MQPPSAEPVPVLHPRYSSRGVTNHCHIYSQHFGYCSAPDLMLSRARRKTMSLLSIFRYLTQPEAMQIMFTFLLQEFLDAFYSQSNNGT